MDDAAEPDVGHPTPRDDLDTGHNSDLGTTKDQKIVLAIARGLNQRDTARYAGVSERTVRRRMADPRLLHRVADTQKQIYDQAVAALTASVCNAGDVIVELMQQGQSEDLRFRAAREVLKRVRDETVIRQLIVDHERIERELRERLEALEDAANE